MPDIVLTSVFLIAVPLLAGAAFFLGGRDGRAGVEARAAAVRSLVMIVLLVVVLQLTGILGSIATALIPCLYLLAWGSARSHVAVAD